MADHDLVIQDAEHSHAADNVALAQTHYLAIADAEHGHIATDYALSIPGVILVSQWTPEDAAEHVGQGSSVKVDFEAAHTEELELLYDEGQDFVDGGTLTDAAVIGDELRLATVSVEEDFEVPRHSDGADITASNHWTKIATNGACTINDAIAGETNQYARYRDYNVGGVWTFDDFGAADSDVDIRARIRFDQANGDAGLAARVTGTGTGTRGYACHIRAHDNQVGIGRFNGAGGGSGRYSLTAVYFGVDADQWYSMRFRVSGTFLGVKVWEEGSPEPVSWTSATNNSVHAGPGGAGLFFNNGTANGIKQADDFAVSSIPDTYAAAGDWETPNLDLASVNRYSSSRISWEETTPTDTAVTVEVSKNGGSYAAATNGGQIPGYTYDEWLGDDYLTVKVSLTSTDDSATPAVENLRLYFDPCSFAALELIVDTLSATEANGKLFGWGKRQVTATVEHEAWNDLHADAARLAWYNHPGAGVSLNAELKYNGVSIDSITFGGDTIPVKEAIGPVCYYILPALALESSPHDNVQEWNPAGKDINSNRVFEWTVIDKGVNTLADAYYYVGHPTRLDVPSSLLAAHVALDGYLSSMLVEGYSPDNFPSSSLSQARRRDDFPTSLLPAIVTLENFLGATVVAIRRLDDQPASLLVYGVNRENVLELHVISETTYTALTGEGISWT